MANDFRSNAKKTSEALRTLADLLGNERFTSTMNELANNPKERELSKKDPRAYFKEHGVEVPASIKVEPKPDIFSNICITWTDERNGSHGICVVFKDGSIVEIETW
jgi:hypothetical protein